MRKEALSKGQVQHKAWLQVRTPKHIVDLRVLEVLGTPSCWDLKTLMSKQEKQGRAQVKQL